MSDEQPFYIPNLKPTPPRRPQPGEYLFEFLHGRDRYLVELRDHGLYGVEAQIFKNEEFRYSRRFDPLLDPGRPPRELAIAWAEEERKDIESGKRDRSAPWMFQDGSTVMADDAHDDASRQAENLKPTPARQPKASEHLFAFEHGNNRIRCQLDDQGKAGVEAQFFANGEFRISRRFDTRALAIQWAEEERKNIEKGGAR